MKKYQFYLIGLFVMLLAGCSHTEAQKEKTQVLVGAAASLKKPMEEIKILFEQEKENVDISYTFGSSGAMEQQITQGVEMDVFFTAAQKNMDRLIEGGYILEDTKEDILENKVVLIVPKGSELGIEGFMDIGKAEVLALGDPASVPVGEYAQEVFRNLGIEGKIPTKITYGKDVTEVLTWVSTGNADAGVVYVTEAMNNEQVKMVEEAPAGSCSRIIYPAAVVKNTKNETMSKEFVEFLSSNKGKKVFEKYGFITQN